MENSNYQSRTNLSLLQSSVELLKQQISSIIIGNENNIEYLCIALLADGHVLLEGVPGVAKTMTAKLLAHSVDAEFKRIQFTPDLMPSDIIGTSIFNVKTQEFEFKQGPLFTNIVLADEINRAPAKTQSALFEAMEERQVTSEGKTYKLDYPFMVIATQNPIEQEGTYRLPEAQLDRFLFKIHVTYPTMDQELKILSDFHIRKNVVDFGSIAKSLTKDVLKEIRQVVLGLHIEERLLKYIAQIVQQTRKHNAIYLGASPRASLAILNASKACAAIKGRDFVIPDDIKHVALPILRHRIILTPDKEMEGVTNDQVILQLLETIEVPR